jgi:hypothetical protein
LFRIVVACGFRKEDPTEDFDRAAEDKTGLKTQCQLRCCLERPPNMDRKRRPADEWKNNVRNGEVLAV